MHAATVIASGIAPRNACLAAIAEALTDDPEMSAAVNHLGGRCFESPMEANALAEPGLVAPRQQTYNC